MPENLTISRGAGFFRDCLAKDEVGAGFDLTGFTLTSQIRKTSRGSVLKVFSVDIVDAVNGHFTLSLTADEATELPLGSLCYDILFTPTTGEPSRSRISIVDVLPRITH